LTPFESRYLQIDHRIPYLVAGDAENEEPNPSDYMLLCASCNRAKSWSCEHCANGVEYKNPDLCKNCFWADPLNYTHVALRPIRRLDVVWAEDEVQHYERLKADAELLGQPLPDYVKAMLHNYVLRGDDTA
jgi:hypothetical protein